MKIKTTYDISYECAEPTEELIKLGDGIGIEKHTVSFSQTGHLYRFIGVTTRLLYELHVFGNTNDKSSPFYDRTWYCSGIPLEL